MNNSQHWTETQRRQQICELLRNKGIICRTYLLTGSCPRSPMCPYMHIRNGEVRMLPWSVCTFFNNGVCLRDNCSYFHGSQEQLDKLRASGVKVYKPQDYMKIASPPTDCIDENSDMLHKSESQNSLTSVQQPSELLSVASLPLTLPIQIRYNEATPSTLSKEQISSLPETELVNFEMNIPQRQHQEQIILKEEKQQQQQEVQSTYLNSSSWQHNIPSPTQTKTISTAATTLANVVPVNPNCVDRTLYLPHNNMCSINKSNTILWSASNNCTSNSNSENNSSCNKINYEGDRQSQLILTNSLLQSSKLENANNVNNIAIMQSNLIPRNQVNSIPIACQISPSLQPTLPNVQSVEYRYLNSYNPLQINSPSTPANSRPTITLLTNIPQSNPLTLPVLSTPPQLFSQEINQSSYQQPVMEQQKIFISQEQLEYLRRQQQQQQQQLNQEQERAQLLQQQQQQQQQQQSPQKFQVYLMTSNQTVESKAYEKQ